MSNAASPQCHGSNFSPRNGVAWGAVDKYGDCRFCQTAQPVVDGVVAVHNAAEAIAAQTASNLALFTELAGWKPEADAEASEAASTAADWAIVSSDWAR